MKLAYRFAGRAALVGLLVAGLLVWPTLSLPLPARTPHTSPPSSPATSGSQTLVFSASAYGTFAFVGSTVTLGKTAPVGVGATGCGTTQVGASQTGTVASVTDPPLITTGLINTSAASTSTSATASSDVNQVNLLASLITADEVKSVSTTSQTSSGLQVSAAGSNVVNLVVNGTSFSAVPPPNTTVQLPGFGHVILNEQITFSSSSSAKLTVNMIHVFITLSNSLGIPVGTQIIVADANSGLTVVGGPAGILDGTAFGTEIMGKLVHSSPTAPASVGCQGTNGEVITNSVASVNIPPEVTTGTVTDTAQGNITPSLASAATTSTVQTANLASGLVTVDVVTAAANGSTTDGVTFNFSDTGSSFVHLQVAGHPEIKDDVPPNTKVTLDGLGTLFLFRVITTSNSIEVRMIEIVVTQNNSLGIPIGTDIRVADASASLHSNTVP